MWGRKREESTSIAFRSQAKRLELSTTEAVFISSIIILESFRQEPGMRRVDATIQKTSVFIFSSEQKGILDGIQHGILTQRSWCCLFDVFRQRQKELPLMATVMAEVRGRPMDKLTSRALVGVEM